MIMHDDMLSFLSGFLFMC